MFLSYFPSHLILCTDTTKHSYFLNIKNSIFFNIFFHFCKKSDHPQFLFRYPNTILHKKNPLPNTIENIISTFYFYVLCIFLFEFPLTFYDKCVTLLIQIHQHHLKFCNDFCIINYPCISYYNNIILVNCFIKRQ